MHSTDFVALYRGPTVGEARLVAVIDAPEVVGQVIQALIGAALTPEFTEVVPQQDDCRWPTPSR